MHFADTVTNNKIACSANPPMTNEPVIKHYPPIVVEAKTFS